MHERYSFKVITDFLDNAFLRFPDKTGLIFENQKYTYRQIKEGAENISSSIADKTKKGDIVALLLENRPEMIFSYFGVLGAGRVVLLIGPNVSDSNFLFQIEKTNPKIIISQPKFESKLERTGIIKKVKYVNVEDLRGKKRFKTKGISEKDVSTIIFTSGATGEPKGVVLRHYNVVSATKNITEFLKWNENDVDVNILPLSHSFGLGNIHCVFAAAGTVILFRDAINLKKILQAIAVNRATTFAAVPATLRLVLDNYYEDFKKCATSLRFLQTDTSLLDRDLIEKILSVLKNMDFNYYYGLTEASRTTFFSINKHLDKIASVGKALDNVKIKIINEENRILPPEEAGEISVKGRHVAENYWGNPEASKRIEGGWLKTGDIGYLDKDGYLYFKARKDDIINVSGEKVLPEEVENVAKKVPGVKDVAAVGIEDLLLGQVVKLFVVADYLDFDAQKVIQECRRELENYKVPRAIEIIKEIPRTENGKVRRSLLKNGK